MAFIITDIINCRDETKLSSFEQFLKENPKYLGELDASGELPLGRAIRGGDLRLVKTLMKYGAKAEHLNRQGESALRIATKLASTPILGALIAQSNDLSSGFNFKADFKDDLPELIGKFIGCWLSLSLIIWLFGGLINLIVSATIAENAAMAAFQGDWQQRNGVRESVFNSTFLAGLWISAIISTFIALIIMLFIAYDYVKEHYIIAPGYLGRQQKLLVDAIDTRNLVKINAIIAENINWLFAPITFFRNNAFMLLASSKAGRMNLLTIMPQIAASTSALNNLLSSKSNIKLLSKHPELLQALIDALSTEMLIQYQDELYPLFSVNLQFFKKHNTASTLTFAKLTDAWSSSDLLETLAATHDTSFIPIALAADTSPMAQLSKGYIALRGMYGYTPNDTDVYKAFGAVDKTDSYIYVQAQSELGHFYMARLNTAAESQIKQDTHWIIQFFTGLSHLNNAIAVKVNASDASSERTKRIQTHCKEFLALLDDNPEDILSSLENTNTLDWKTTEGDTPIMVAAKAGHWQLVKVIANKHPANEINGDQYTKALFLAMSENQTNTVIALLGCGTAIPPGLEIEETRNNLCHEAIRLGDIRLLEQLLVSDQTGFIANHYPHHTFSESGFFKPRENESQAFNINRLRT